MKESIFMRVLLCKIHCPFICFCKPSAAHLYSSGPLKLENRPHVSSTAVAVADAPDESSVESAEVKEESVDGKQAADDNVLKSCIRKQQPLIAEADASKKRVQWMDNLGKELAEIKEFESSETGDTDNEEESSRCLCIIL